MKTVEEIIAEEIKRARKAIEDSIRMEILANPELIKLRLEESTRKGN